MMVLRTPGHISSSSQQPPQGRCYCYPHSAERETEVRWGAVMTPGHTGSAQPCVCSTCLNGCQFPGGTPSSATWRLTVALLHLFAGQALCPPPAQSAPGRAFSQEPAAGAQRAGGGHLADLHGLVNGLTKERSSKLTRRTDKRMATGMGPRMGTKVRLLLFCSCYLKVQILT